MLADYQRTVSAISIENLRSGVVQSEKRRPLTAVEILNTIPDLQEYHEETQRSLEASRRRYNGHT